MRAILLDGDILIADALDVKFSQEVLRKPKDYYSFKVEEIKLSFWCEHRFINNFFGENHRKNGYIYSVEYANIRSTALLIFEDLSYKHLYGLKPVHVLYGDEGYSKIDFRIDHFLSDDMFSSCHDIEKKWLKHNRNRRIDEILKK